jgi:hypothetical protein
VKQVLLRFGLWILIAIAGPAAAQLPPPPIPQQIGLDPVFGAICAGPFGPGPCLDVQRFLWIQLIANGIPVQQIAYDPQAGPICAGPLGPGPCRQVQVFLATQQLAVKQVTLATVGNPRTCMGPLGPGPCDAVRNYIMRMQSGMGQMPQSVDLRSPDVLAHEATNGEAMCTGPFGPSPCSLVAQMGLDMMRGNVASPGSFGLPSNVANVQKLAQECAKRTGLDVASFAGCTGQKAVLPARQQAVLDCAVSSTSKEAFGECAAPMFGISLSKEQRKLAGCAAKSDGDEDGFKACMGAAAASGALSTDERAVLSCATNPDPVGFGKCAALRLISQEQKAVLTCATSAGNAAAFASCAAPYSGIKMSNDQRIIAKCAMKSEGDENDFAACAGTAFLANNLGPNEEKILGCAASANGDSARFAGCSANALLGNKLSKEQQVAVQCAAQSQGDAAGFATCAGANMLNLQLNPEQQIAVQCVVSTGGQPHLAAGCMASRLTARELSKCLANGIGGEEGCFGDNNDLVGKNGWVGRTLGQVAGGPNSVINNPGQIWGGDNSFVKNPGQIWGGSNSFVRSPSQIWGGPNSVFNNPGQLLPQPRPVQIGTVAGKRICLPWC